MAQFNLADYETVKSRKKRFYKDHSDARIIVELISPEKILEYALFKASIFINADDLKNNLPKAVGYAQETRDINKQINQYGKEYESVNYSSWCENCEESAIGRALDNAGYSSNGKCSQEEIKKVIKTSERKEQPKPKFTLNDKPVIPNNNRFLIKTGRYAGKSFADIPESEIKVYLESANKMELTSREDLETRDQLNKLYGEFYGKK